MKDKKDYLEYLKYNKNYSDKTITNYEIDLNDFFKYLNQEGLDYKSVEYEDLMGCIAEISERLTLKWD